MYDCYDCISGWHTTDCTRWTTVHDVCACVFSVNLTPTPFILPITRWRRRCVPPCKGVNAYNAKFTPRAFSHDLSRHADVLVTDRTIYVRGGRGFGDSPTADRVRKRRSSPCVSDRSHIRGTTLFNETTVCGPTRREFSRVTLRVRRPCYGAAQLTCSREFARVRRSLKQKLRNVLCAREPREEKKKHFYTCWDAGIVRVRQ